MSSSRSGLTVKRIGGPLRQIYCQRRYAPGGFRLLAGSLDHGSGPRLYRDYEEYQNSDMEQAEIHMYIALR